MRTSDHPLRLGFIGGGVNSAIGSAHFAAAMLDRRFEVVSGCFSRRSATNAETAARWAIDAGRCHTDWRRYLEQEQERLDAIAILTPIPAHYEQIRASLACHLPVISEKALVSNVDEARRLGRDIAHGDHFLAVTLNYSGYPIVRLLRQMVREGRFGQLQQLHLEMPLENYLRVPEHRNRPAAPQPWRLADGRVPTLLLDLGVHLHHLMAFVTGAEAVRVMADLHRFSTVGDVVDDARLWIDCDSGMQTSMWMSKTALGYRNGMRLRLFGDRGSAEWVQCEPEVLRVTDVHGRRSEIDRGLDDPLLCAARYNRFKAGHPAGYIEAFGNLYWDIADALLAWRDGARADPMTDAAHQPYVFGLEHSMAGLALLEAAVGADDSGRWTTVSSGNVQLDIAI